MYVDRSFQEMKVQREAKGWGKNISKKNPTGSKGGLFMQNRK